MPRTATTYCDSWPTWSTSPRSRPVTSVVSPASVRSSRTTFLTLLQQSKVDLLRAGFQALKALAMMAYYKQPPSWKAIGYAGPVVDWGKQ